MRKTLGKFLPSFALIVVAMSITTCVNNAQVANDVRTDSRSAKAVKEAERMFDVVIKGRNYERIADFTHPKGFDIPGGREKYVEIMRDTFQSAHDLFGDSLKWSFEEPGALVAANNNIFVVIPRILTGTTQDKKYVRQEGYMVGISSDNGETWKFIGGTGFVKSFPENKDVIQVPKEKTFIDGVEQ